MKIVHLCLGCFYIDNYSYQENMLPKFHKEMGYEVEVIASTLSFDKNGNGCNIAANKYINEYGIKVTRLPYKKRLPVKLCKFLRIYEGTYNALEEANPDIIFIHGCQFCDIYTVVSYLKKHKAQVFVDNHADFSNSATNWISKNILHKGLWRTCAHAIEPYTTKFYGVLPVRVDFLEQIYRLPEEKCELLVMGADDELVNKAKKNGAREKIRKKYSIQDDEFLIITGGKIDKWKTQTLLLMEAINKIQIDNIKLIIFGSITQELKPQVENLIDNSNGKIKYIGWIQSKDSYEVFGAADLVIFPGRHSVMWEQVVGQGIPMIVKDWPGTHHVDLGGNVRFLKDDSVQELTNEIEHVYNEKDLYNNMKAIAQSKGMETFSYKMISKRAIGGSV